ncbi:hypothetical protein BD413DRAFT_556152 [Trametes elegans]|nr:hypothetical protein BD413DRAFT_556152 [Trametes elegans]
MALLLTPFRRSRAWPDTSALRVSPRGFNVQPAHTCDASRAWEIVAGRSCSSVRGGPSSCGGAVAHQRPSEVRPSPLTSISPTVGRRAGKSRGGATSSAAVTAPNTSATNPPRRSPHRGACHRSGAQTRCRSSDTRTAFQAGCDQLLWCLRRTTYEDGCCGDVPAPAVGAGTIRVVADALLGDRILRSVLYGTA